jgi:ATP-dependent RNA helicase DeaD
MPFPPAHPGLLRALAERGYDEPTPVQAAVLDPSAASQDLLVSAETGSGKTVAYGLLMGETLLDGAPRLPRQSPTLALVIAPTRELAVQVQSELAWLYAPTGTRVVACVGGMDPRREQRELAEGAPIVVGTPGRLRDHLERGRLDLSRIAVVVLDEADEMLDLGFKEELEALLQATPGTRRTLMFSATIPRSIAALARQYQKDAVRISTTDEDAAHGDIEYRAVMVLPRERDLAVVNLLRYFEVRGALVFCSTRAAVNHLAANLLERGFSVVALSGELSQAERTRALQSLRDGRARVCVATDVAARGLDLPDLGLVIHADPPRDRQTLLHRSGRTGRAGRKGVTVVIVPVPARGMAERLLGGAKVQARWSPAPSSDDIRARDQARLTADVASLTADAGEDELAAARAILAERTPEQVATALVRLHRSLQPSPEELTVPVERQARPVRPSGDAHDPRPSRGASKGNWALFRLNVGSTKNADPRWLIPLLCKRGGITRHEIGAIRISFRDTTVEIAAHAADKFASQARRPSSDPRDKHIRIEPFRPRATREQRRS